MPGLAVAGELAAGGQVPVMRMVSAGSEMPGMFLLSVSRPQGSSLSGRRSPGWSRSASWPPAWLAVRQLAPGCYRGRAVVSGAGRCGPGCRRVLWCAGIGVGGTAGPGLVFGLFGRLSRRRLIAWVRREPWDSARRPTWRLASGAAMLAAPAAL